MFELDFSKKLRNKKTEFNLDIKIKSETDENIFLFGESGSGKTSILNLIAGIIKPDSGIIKIKNEIYFDDKKKINLKIQDRKISYLFQEYRIFENMTVKKNITYAMGKNYNLDELENLLEISKLKKYENDSPAKLSGGQKQRLALVRSLARKPEIILLDEPFSALDYCTKQSLMNEFMNLKKIYNFIPIIVSHNIKEIIHLSGRVFFINEGKIIAEKKLENIKENINFKECHIQKFLRGS